MARLPRRSGRIPIQKIETQNNREVTFSKRRNGVYRKASELNLLCDCDVAVIIFSPENNIFAFGEPSVQQILDTFMAENPQHQNSEMESLTGDHNNRESCQPPNQEEIMGHKASIEDHKTREKTITNSIQVENCLKKWWLIPAEDLTLDEAEKMVEKLEEFKYSIDSHGTHIQSTSSVSTLPPPSYMASTSYGVDPNDKGKAPMEY